MDRTVPLAEQFPLNPFDIHLDSGVRSAALGTVTSYRMDGKERFKKNSPVVGHRVR
jgi:hypothetical protein